MDAKEPRSGTQEIRDLLESLHRGTKGGTLYIYPNPYLI